MGKKNNNNNFNNIVAVQSKDERRWRIMDEEKIYEYMNKDFDEIITQLGKNLVGISGAKYPTYIQNIFTNPSVCKFIFQSCEASKDTLKGLSNEYNDIPDSHDIENIRLRGMRHLVAMGYKEVSLNQNPDMDKNLKLEMLANAFKFVDRDRVKLAKKFKVYNDGDKEDADLAAKQLAIHAYIGEDHAWQLIKFIDLSPLSDKDKFKLFKAITDNWKKVVGGCFTIVSSQKFVDYLYKEFCKAGKKTRKKILTSFARQFKKKEKRNFNLESDQFFKDNDKIIKKLVLKDIGFYKALTPLKDQMKMSKKK